MQITASEMKQKFGTCIEAAQREPILVMRSGRPSVVVVSVEEYNRLKALEDSYWGILAEKAKKNGFLSDDEASKWFKDMQEKLNADT